MPNISEYPFTTSFKYNEEVRKALSELVDNEMNRFHPTLTYGKVQSTLIRQAIISYLESQTDDKDDYADILKRDRTQILDEIKRITGEDFESLFNELIDETLRRQITHDLNLKTLFDGELTVKNPVVQRWIEKKAELIKAGRLYC